MPYSNCMPSGSRLRDNPRPYLTDVVLPNRCLSRLSFQEEQFVPARAPTARVCAPCLGGLLPRHELALLRCRHRFERFDIGLVCPLVINERSKKSVEQQQDKPNAEDAQHKKPDINHEEYNPRPDFSVVERRSPRKKEPEHGSQAWRLHFGLANKQLRFDRTQLIHRITPSARPAG
jgi:hypothetical protein